PYHRFMVEQFVPGMSLTVGVLELDGKLRCLPPLESETEREFYDYTAKHDPAQRIQHCPVPLDEAALDRLEATALRVHELVGAHGVSRVDFIRAPDGRTPVLEINTGPGLAHMGNLATMAQVGGISYEKLMVALLETAFTKTAYVP
ncbi:MAG: hypothetical protein ACRDQX_04050, partial [Pseudonocardiaceae bacterium]